MKVISNMKTNQVTLEMSSEELEALHYALNQYSQKAREPYLTWAEWYETLDDEDKAREGIIEDFRRIEIFRRMRH